MGDDTSRSDSILASFLEHVDCVVSRFPNAVVEGDLTFAILVEVSGERGIVEIPALDRGRSRLLQTQDFVS